MLTIAHRGASGSYPENTLLAFSKALAAGCDGIEFDVQNIDGNLIAFHDDTLERTTNGVGKVSDYSFEQLRQLDAGQGEQIPTLQEVIEFVGDKAFLNIELKGKNTASLVVEAIKQLEKATAHKKDFIISSFHYSELLEVHKLDAELKLAVIADDHIDKALEFAQQIQAYSFHPCLEKTNKKLINKAHDQGMKIYVFTVNELTDIELMRYIGVDGVFTDYPNDISN